MKDTVIQFLDYMKNVKEVSKNTLASYRLDLEKLMTYLQELQVQDINNVNETMLNSYILYLEKNRLKSATVARNIVTIKAYFLYLVKHRLIEEDPTERIRSPKIIKHPPVNLSFSQVERLLEAPDQNELAGKRDKAMFELLYATGMKASELIALRIGDLNLTYNIVVCAGEKKQRVIPFGETAKKVLMDYLAEAREVMCKGEKHEYVFVNRNGLPLSRQGFWKIIKKYAQEIGIEEMNPRILRNSFAAHLLENGADVSTVGEMLGFSDPAMASVYGSSNKARVREEYMKAHPRR